MTMVMVIMMGRGITSQRVSGSMPTEWKFSSWGSADSWRVNRLEVYAGIPRSEKSQTSGCD